MIISFVIYAAGGSLWPTEKKSPYSAPKALLVGDIITILIEETTKAASAADTNTSKKSGLDANIDTNWSQVASALTSRGQNKAAGKFSADADYSGKGATNRSSIVKATVSVIVKKILPNGNLLIQGDHHVNVNDETETISIEGVIRPEDITGDNTIYSSQIADAKISIKGSGTVGSKQAPGILSKLFDWMF